MLVLKPRSDEEASLEAEIIERLGVHVDVKDVRHGSDLVLVPIHFPELSPGELSAWREWLHSELRARGRAARWSGDRAALPGSTASMAPAARCRPQAAEAGTGVSHHSPGG